MDRASAGSRRRSSRSSTLRTNADRALAFDRLLAEVSAGFINLDARQVDAAIIDALRRIAGLLQVDRAQLIRFTRGQYGARVSHSGAIAGIAEGAPDVELDRGFPWALACVRRGQTIAYARLDELPPEAAVDRAVLARYGVKSELIVPLRVGGAIDGALVLDCDQTERDWPPEVIDRVQSLTTILGNALAHQRAASDVEAAMRFEQLVSSVLARLLAAPAAQRDEVLDTALSELARALDADRATLWRRGEGGRGFARLRRWWADAGAADDSVDDLPLTWIVGQLEQQRTVTFDGLHPLPAEASDDAEALRQAGIGAAIVVPLLVDGRLDGAFSLARRDPATAWPLVLPERVRLLGEALASFLAMGDAERREAEAEAKAVHAARVGSMGLFAASLVHELTQPVSALLANAESAVDLAAREQPDAGAMQAALADMLADAHRAADLIQRLRRFLRRGEDERRELAPAELLQDVRRIASVEARARGLNLQVEVGAGLPDVLGDRVQLQQVLLNLLLNALDAARDAQPTERVVTLRATSTDGGLQVDVIDRGCGIDAAALPRIFQPFLSTKPGGMGLGLSISRTLVAAHGGRLWLESAVGSGTTAHLWLPAADTVAPVADTPAAASVDRDAVVYLVDDDATLRRAMARQLADAGYRVEACANGHALLAIERFAPVCCLVCDLRMPGIGGLELQAQLARAGRDLPIVFVSGHADVPTTAQAMRAGAVTFLAKPVGRAELLAAVAEALARSRERLRLEQADAALHERLGSLTVREREVFDLVVAGTPNKLIADRLAIAEPTVKIHRGRVMRKMQAASLAELVRMAQGLGGAAA